MLDFVEVIDWPPKLIRLLINKQNAVWLDPSWEEMKRLGIRFLLLHDMLNWPKHSMGFLRDHIPVESLRGFE